MLRLRLVSALSLLAVTACGPSTPASDAGVDAPTDGGACAANGASLTLTTGSLSSIATQRPLMNGDDVYLVPGPQGGQHIWIGARATGFSPTLPLVDLKLYRVPDGQLIGAVRFRFPWMSTGAPGEVGIGGQTLVVDDDQYCTVLPGDARMTYTVNDGAGHCFTGERRVHVAGVEPSALEIDRLARERCCTERLPRCYPNGPGPTDAGAGDGG